MMTTTQIEDAVRMFCVMGTRDGISVSGHVQGYLYVDGDFNWSAALCGRTDGAGSGGAVLVTGSNMTPGESPGDALVQAYQDYTSNLDAYLAEQAEEVGA